MSKAYEDQEELIASILAQAPKVSKQTMRLLVREQAGVEMTHSCWTNAQKRFQAIKEVPLSDKDTYIYALFTKLPDLTRANVNAKTRRYFNMESRGDHLEAIRARARKHPMSDADQVLKEVQARVHKDAGFGLG